MSQFNGQSGFQQVLGYTGNLNDSEQQVFNRQASQIWGNQGEFGFQQDPSMFNQGNGGFFQDSAQEQDQDGANWWKQYDVSSTLETIKPPQKKPVQKKRQVTAYGTNDDFGELEMDDNVLVEPEEREKFLTPRYRLVWTYGSAIVTLLILVVEIACSGGLESLKSNPLAGPSALVMVKMGAKYGPLILKSDWWRLFTAIFLHTGIIHWLLTVILLGLSKEVEYMTGFWRSFFIYMVAGTYGNIVACLFEPELVECGANGAIFGWLGMLLADLISSWKTQARPGRRLTVIIAEIVVCLAIGLTPYVNNFSHIGGFIMGLLSALMLLPHINFGSCERVCRGIIAFIAYPLMTTLFTLSLVIFYRRVDDSTSWCSFCHYLNCVNVSGWCSTTKNYSSQNLDTL